MKTGLLLAGLRINFNQGAPLAGFITPCVAVWDRSGLIFATRFVDILVKLPLVEKAKNSFGTPCTCVSYLASKVDNLVFHYRCFFSVMDIRSFFGKAPAGGGGGGSAAKTKTPPPGKSDAGKFPAKGGGKSAAASRRQSAASPSRNKASSKMS